MVRGKFETIEFSPVLFSVPAADMSAMISPVVGIMMDVRAVFILPDLLQTNSFEWLEALFLINASDCSLLSLFSLVLLLSVLIPFIFRKCPALFVMWLLIR